MNQPTLLGKLLSPAGFGLALLLFFLPFVAVSCGPDNDSITASLSGAALLTGAPPVVGGSALAEDDQAMVRLMYQEQFDLEPLVLLSAVVIMAGMAIVFIRPARRRLLTGAVLALVAATLLVGGVLRAINRIEQTDVTGFTIQGDRVYVSTDYGFWLATGFLLALAIAHGLAWVRAPAAASAEPPTVNDPGGHDQATDYDTNDNDLVFGDDGPARI